MKLSNQKIIYISSLCILLAGTVTSVSAQQDPVQPMAERFYDTDRNLMLEDSDNDGTPDLTESLGGTDPLNPKNYPGSDTIELEKTIEAGISATTEAAGFPAPNCRAGFQLAGARLCVSENVQGAADYHWAQRRCRVQRARVASYEDLYYLYFHSNLDASYNPNGRWIGNMTADDQALCGNRNITMNGDPDQQNFEGTCDKTDNLTYWCVHDRE